MLGSLALVLPGPGALSGRLAPAGAPAAARIGQAGAVPPGWRRLGALPARTVLHLEVLLVDSATSKMAAFATAVSTPGSPRYRAYATTAGLAAAFGASRAAIGVTEAALEDAGLHHLRLQPDHLGIAVTASAGAVEHAFSTPLTAYRSRSGATGYANELPPRLPGGAAGEVSAVVGLDSLDASGMAVADRPARAARSPQRAGPREGGGAGAPFPAASATCQSQISESDLDALSPGDIASLYGFENLYAAGDTAAGVTIALIEFAPYEPGDIEGFEQCYGLSDPVVPVEVDGGAGPPSTHGAVAGIEQESELDIETVASLAPGATILVYEAPQNATDAETIDVLSAAIDNPQVDVVSTSWGDCEADNDRSLIRHESVLFAEAAAEGKSVVAASGDEGSEDCYGTLHGPKGDALAVDDPASQPDVTAVGGTELAPGEAHVETTWSGNAKNGASGGGVSSIWPMPPYQAYAPRALHVVNRYSGCPSRPGDCREVPDVAADAGTPFGVYCTEADCGTGEGGVGWTPLYGTSLAAPIWAALFALADASPSCAGTRVGFANPALYAIAAGPGYAAAFHDITTGDNDIGFQGDRYPAGRGYNLATGLGTPITGSGTGADDGLVDQLCTTHPSYPLPTVSRLSPARGDGGNAIVITGTNFVTVHAVRVGTTRVAFVVRSPSLIEVTLPAGSGWEPVTVTTDAGTSAITAGGLFHYRPPPTAPAGPP